MDTLDSLTLQLTEVEMLSSMFPTEGEFELDDPSAVIVIKDFVEGAIKYEYVNPRIGFTLKLESSESKTPLQLVAHLPHEYPNTLPEVFVRCECLSKSVHGELNNDLLRYIREDVDRGELCMCYVVQWLQDNTDRYVKASREETQQKCPEKKEPRTPKGEKLFSRMWIYSHHIYSKIKRKDILEFADELNLTGFSMPGKPGIIAIEGYNSCVEEFWGRIRRMQWKRLVMKEKEDYKIEDTKSVDSYRKFTGFGEKYFEPRQAKGRNAHGDRGLLFQFLEERGCGHVFQYYFGVEGRSNEPDSDGD